MFGVTRLTSINAPPERSDSISASAGGLQGPLEGPAWAGTWVQQGAATSTTGTAGVRCPSLEIMVREPGVTRKFLQPTFFSLHLVSNNCPANLTMSTEDTRFSKSSRNISTCRAGNKTSRR